VIPVGTSESECGEEEAPIHESDSDRRQMLLSSEQNDDLQGLKACPLWDLFQRDFISGGQGTSHVDEAPVDHDTGYSSSSKGKRKHEAEGAEERHPINKVARPSGPPLGIGRLVQSEINIRRKESLGMEPVKGGGRMLGTGTSDFMKPSHNVANGPSTVSI